MGRKDTRKEAVYLIPILFLLNNSALGFISFSGLKAGIMYFCIDKYGNNRCDSSDNQAHDYHGSQIEMQQIRCSQRVGVGGTRVCAMPSPMVRAPTT